MKINIAVAAMWLAMTGTLSAQENAYDLNAANENTDNEAMHKEFDATFPPGEPICFTRSYGRAHLARHRSQTLRMIAIGHSKSNISSERAWDRDVERSRQINPQALSSVERRLYVSAKFHRDRRRYGDNIVCDGTNDGRISCRTDGCDTANQRIYIKIDGARHILARPDGISLRGTCGDDAPSRSLRASDHEGPIRLERAPMAECVRK